MLPIQCLIGFKRLSKSSGGLHFYEIITSSLLNGNYGGFAIKICFKSNIKVYFKNMIEKSIESKNKIYKSYTIITI